jgi:plasmid stability protein
VVVSTKATLYLDEKVFRALKVQAAQSDRSMSETANALLRRGLSGEASKPENARTVELRFEGKSGVPVLHGLEALPKDYIFSREDIYD